MYIKEDYSYILEGDSKLIDSGLGRVRVHSVHFDRYFTDEEKKRNHKEALSLSKEAWGKSCTDFSKRLEVVMKDILSRFTTGEFLIYHIPNADGTTVSYKDAWDLYYMSGIDREYLDYFSLTFNQKRSASEEEILLKKVLAIAKEFPEDKQVYCRVQYRADIDQERVNAMAKECFQLIENKPITYRGMRGTIRLVRSENAERYAFFKKRARTSCYPVGARELVAMCI